MRKSNGTPILVCDCSRPHGTPLLVQFKNELAFSGRITPDYRIFLTNVRVSEDFVRLTGNCPVCKRFVEIRKTSLPNRILDELRAELTWKPIDDYVWDLTGTLEPEKEISFMSPHVRIIPMASRRFVGSFAEPDLPSPRGPQTLHINSWDKHLFARLLLDFGRQLEPSQLPAWYSNGTEADFTEWIEEIERTHLAYAQARLQEEAGGC